MAQGYKQDGQVPDVNVCPGEQDVQIPDVLQVAQSVLQVTMQIERELQVAHLVLSQAI